MMVDEIRQMGPSQFFIYKDPDTRTLMHISTDKMIYKPKDVMFVEVHLVDSITKKPYIIPSEIQP
jgi:hypothetical protein